MANMYLDCDVEDIFEFVEFDEDIEGKNPYYDFFVNVGKNDYVMYVYEENFNDVKDEHANFCYCFQSIYDEDPYRDSKNVDRYYNEPDDLNRFEVRITSKPGNNVQVAFSNGIEYVLRVRDDSKIKFFDETEFQHFVYKYFERNPIAYRTEKNDGTESFFTDSPIHNISVQKVDDRYIYLPEDKNLMNQIDEDGYDETNMNERVSLGQR